ncbi:MAG: hypothetical protein QXD15_02090 [Thermoplasmata archaeon]
MLKKDVAISILLCAALLTLFFPSLAEGSTTEAVKGISFIDNGVIRVCVNLEWGGAICEIRYSGVNLIDAHDTGRLIQLSLYAGGEYYNYTDCTDPNWGWNPVQGGDKYNHGSPVLAYYNRGYEIYIKTTPYEWNPDNKGGGPNTPVLSDVIFEQWVMFGPNPNVLKVRYRVTTLSTAERGVTGQEFPCIYTNPILNKLVVYEGNNPWTYDALSVYDLPIHPNPAVAVETAEYWVALKNESGLALGIYSENLCSSFLGLGFPASVGTSYFRGNRVFSLHGSGVVEDEWYLIVGEINEVRSEIYALHENRTLTLSWDFENTDNWNEMWYWQNQIASFEIANGSLSMVSTGDDPYLLLMHELGIDATWHNKIEMRLFVSSGSTGALYFTTSTSRVFDEAKKLEFTVYPGTFTVYLLDFSRIPTWEGVIERLRFDPTNSIGEIKVDYIRFLTAPQPQIIPLYRLYSLTLTDHMYTADPVERQWALQFGYTDEGVLGYILDRRSAESVPLYSLYLANSTDNFYTVDDLERKSAMTSGAVYEGVVGYCYLNPSSGLLPVYRLYNQATGDHFYTTSWSEAEYANNSLGYTYEGIGFYVYPIQNVSEGNWMAFLLLLALCTANMANTAPTRKKH